MIKKLIAVLFILPILTAGGIYYLIHTHWFYEELLVSLVNRNAKQFQIQSLKIGGRHVRLPKQITFSDLEVILKSGGNVFQISSEYVEINNSFFISKKYSIADVVLRGIRLKNSLIESQALAMGILVHYDLEGLRKFNSRLPNIQAKILGYEFDSITAMVYGDTKEIQLTDLESSFYGGSIKGEIILDYAPEVSYSIRINLSGVDTGKLRVVNEPVFSQVSGQIDGEIFCQGTRKEVRSLKAKLSLPTGGKLRASLLSALIEYLPQSQERKDLENLVKSSGEVPVEIVAWDIENLGQDQLKTKIDLESKRLNLDMNLSVDVNVDGGILNLIDSHKGMSL